jgi:hypothetical protein
MKMELALPTDKGILNLKTRVWPVGGDIDILLCAERQASAARLFASAEFAWLDYKVTILTVYSFS